MVVGMTVDAARSEIDPSRIITDEHWIISLVRLPDRGNDEHAFLVLEGKTGKTSRIWFIDFVAKNIFDAFLPGLREGKVRIKTFQSQKMVGSSSELLYECKSNLMNIKRNDRLLHSTWLISIENAEILLKNIEAYKEKPPKYILPGDSAIAMSSATSTSNPTGHNCFTFAKKMLLDLQDPYIELPEDRLGDWLYSATSRTLVDKQFREKLRKAMILPLMIAFLLGVLITSAFFTV